MKNMFAHPSLVECEFLVQGKSKRGGLFVRKYISKRRCPTLWLKIKVKEIPKRHSSIALELSQGEIKTKGAQWVLEVCLSHE